MDTNYEPKMVKVSNALKKNIITIIIVLICIAYVLWGLVEIDDSKKSIAEIIGETIISLAMGVSLSTLLQSKAIQDGRLCPKYIASKNLYGTAVEKVSTISEFTHIYCEYKNKLRLHLAREAFLRKHNLRLDLYENGYYTQDIIATLTKSQKKALHKIDRVKIFMVTDEFLFSDVDGEDGIIARPLSVYNYRTKKFTSSVIGKIVFAIVFGAFGVSLAKDLSWANIIMAFLQVMIWIIIGVIAYFDAYEFITERYRNETIIKKINMLEEFNNLWQGKNDIFKGVIKDGISKNEVGQNDVSVQR